ncbi:MAG: cytochrome c [Blastocatellia bacterium]
MIVALKMWSRLNLPYEFGGELMKRKVSIVIVLLALAGLISIGSGAQVAKGKGKQQTGKGKAPAKTVGKAVDAAALYKQHCQKCHAPDGKGIPSLEPPDMTDVKWQAKNNDKQIIEVINEGKGIMPGFKDTLKPAQILALVKHVRSFGMAKSDGENKVDR